jgi:Xaa-Pro aminopeptidase
MTQRLSRLQAQLEPSDLVLISRPLDIFYLTGVSCLVPEEREALLVVSHQVAVLLHSTFLPVSNSKTYQLQAFKSTHQAATSIATTFKDIQATQLVVDEHNLSWQEYQDLTIAGLSNIKNGAHQLVTTLSIIKDQTEIELITQACQITNEILDQIRAKLQVGITEQEIAQFIELELRKKGATHNAFPSIVAFGPHSALPHHQPTSQALTSNTPVLIDMGVTVGNYRSDMTRTWWFGDQPDPEFTKLDKTVHTAYDKALAACRASVSGAEVDRAARQTISEAGWGDKFIHTTGHGVGLEIHEAPSLNPHQTQQLQKNMVITIEPGIYLPNQFGFRFENTILVTATASLELGL